MHHGWLMPNILKRKPSEEIRWFSPYFFLVRVFGGSWWSLGGDLILSIRVSYSCCWCFEMTFCCFLAVLCMWRPSLPTHHSVNSKSPFGSSAYCCCFCSCEVRDLLPMQFATVDQQPEVVSLDFLRLAAMGGETANTYSPNGDVSWWKQ